MMDGHSPLACVPKVVCDSVCFELGKHHFSCYVFSVKHKLSWVIWHEKQLSNFLNCSMMSSKLRSPIKASFPLTYAGRLKPNCNWLVGYGNFFRSTYNDGWPQPFSIRAKSGMRFCLLRTGKAPFLMLRDRKSVV